MAIFTVSIHVEFGDEERYDGEGWIEKTFNKEVIPRIWDKVEFSGVPLSLSVNEVIHNLDNSTIEVCCEIGSALDAFELFLQGGWEYKSVYVNDEKKQDTEKFLEFVEKRRQKLAEQNKSKGEQQ